MDEPESRRAPVVGAVILAAGRSRRFGGSVPKQLHPIDGRTLVRRTAEAVLGSKVRQVVVVTGYRGAEVAAVLAGLAVEVVENRRYAEGQSTSVRAGLARLEAAARAAFFVPCDLPHLDASSIDRLLAVYAESGGPIVVPTHRGRRYAPVLFDRSLFGEIGTITGDRGARQLFPEHEHEIVEVEFDSPRPFRDLDKWPGPPLTKR